jgi:protein SCO1/2
MIKRLPVLFAATLLAAVSAPAQHQDQYQVTGIVLQVGRTHRSLVVSCDVIPGYMSAMEMSFSVRNQSSLRSIHRGTPVRFTMVKRGHVLYANDIQATVGANLESEPMQAGALSTLQTALESGRPAQTLAQGQHVPNFELTDQAGTQVRLSNLAGKVVLLTFGYSRCPNPDYCLRLANNLAGVRDRLGTRSPHDLVLLTIVIDPEYDQGATLSRYAAVWKADPANWHFLTGPLPLIKSVAGMFGMNFWSSEGLLTHTLHTVIIDRSGDLAANLEGNQFTVQQLGDLVESVMDHPH